MLATILIDPFPCVARDARTLVDGGYRLEGVTTADRFRHTPHVELVARFVLKR
jgi:23S rRNA (uracil1939-C5)-methyltransferase